MRLKEHLLSYLQGLKHSVFQVNNLYLWILKQRVTAESAFLFFSLLFIQPFAGIFAPNRQGHVNVTLCKSNTLQGKGAFGEDQHQETTCNGTIAENAACKEHLLPAKPEEWVGVIPLPREPPANITGLVLHGGLTAQKADLPGKSHISFSSWGEKAQPKSPTNPNPHSLCLHRCILC